MTTCCSQAREPGHSLNWRITLGEADEQISRREAAGSNSYRSYGVKALAGLAAYPWALESLPKMTSDSLWEAPVTRDAPDRNWSFWRRLVAEFFVIVAGVLVALGVDAARDSREDRVRAAGYLRHLRIDLSATADALTNAITVEERARASADRMIQALNSSRLPSYDSLTVWIGAATNSSASFYPTMGTVTALIESGELRLIQDEDLRRKVLQYHSSVQGSLRIVDAVNPYMWRTLERLGNMLSWSALLQPEEQQRFTINWESLASDRAFHGAVYDMRLAAHNRLFALTSLRTNLEALLAELDGSD